MDNNKEYIVATAYKLLPEFDTFPSDKRIIYKHKSLWNSYGMIDDIYSIRIARHHAEIIHQYHKLIDLTADGFYTSYGRYVNRLVAKQLALACGQVTEPTIMGNRLDSSDIFK